MFDFKEKFKSSETIVLLRMLETPEKFQPEAVAAAREIIESRKREDSKTFEEVEYLLHKEKKVPHPTHQITEENIDIWEEDEVEKSKTRFTNNRIIAICVAFIGVNILFIYPKINLTINILSNPALYENLTSLAFVFAPLLFSAAGIIFFYKREKTGWILLVFDFTYRLVFSIGVLITFIRFSISGGANEELSSLLYNIIFPLLLFSIMLYQMGSSRIMNIYKATNKTLLNTMAVSIIVAAGYIYLVKINI